MLELKSVDALLAQNKEIAAQIAALTKRMEANQASVIQDQTPQQEGNASESEGDWEQANYVHNSSRIPYDLYSKTYNHGWKNHPNFGWENKQNHNQDHNKPYSSNQHPNHNPNHQTGNHRPYHNSQNTSYHKYHNNQPIHNNLNQDEPSLIMQPCEIKGNFERIEAAMAQLSSQISGAVSTLMDRQAQTDKRIDANQEEYRSNLKNQDAAISKLEAQVGILSKQIPLPTHIFPSNTMANPIGECKAITLRSGKVVEEGAPSKDNHEEVASKHGNKDKGEIPTSPPPKPVLKPYVPKAPYPQRLRRDGKDGQFSKFLEIFKKLEINIPFPEALEQMPLYAKFLKELITKKRNWEAKETKVLTEECNTIIQKKLPQKLKDPGSFQISCIIGDITIEKALCDLGASINLIFLTMMRRMKIEEAKPTRMAL
ncbi:uncharacterized protein LOC107484507 [Arachis duranensis]|uniref:Uncharacterized protein LOC107484507 n=1 Tax=Arachis duranensis TaxID=130453 RepID=A0A6P4D3Y6_ARADU|nr:uncharacterized protein LOC107484507 [Arachis duranensis]